MLTGAPLVLGLGDALAGDTLFGDTFAVDAGGVPAEGEALPAVVELLPGEEVLLPVAGEA